MESLEYLPSAFPATSVARLKSLSAVGKKATPSTVEVFSGGADLDLVKSLGADSAIGYTKEDCAAHGEIYDIIFVAVDK